MKIQLLTFPGCPNAEPARQSLLSVMGQMGLDSSIEEVDLNAAETPEKIRTWASPTILIEGRDVEGGAPCGVGGSCRLYAFGTKTPGLPSPDLIRAALEAGLGRQRRRGVLTALPGAIASLLPGLACPACLGPAVSLLSTLGVGVAIATDIYAYVLFAALMIGVAGAIVTARVHRSPWPLLLTVLGSLAVFAGNVVVIEAALGRFGFPLLIAGAAWNLWLQRQTRTVEAHA